MATKVLFMSAVKHNGKRYPGNTVIEVQESEKKELLAAGAYLVKQGLIGENKNGERIIISVLEKEENTADIPQEKVKGKKGK